jgi:tRNA(His) guanylyltransferase
MLFSEFGINYNDEPEVNRKGSVLFYSFEESAEDEKKTKTRRRNEIVIAHVDIIGSSFWTENKILD